MKTVPVFAIIGHPNEGKSSIVATLAQDDSVPISATPGETIRLQRFDLKVGNEPVIEFIDTPGFQNPQTTLAWFREHEELGNRRVAQFIEEHQDDPDFHHDCELLRPIQDGAGLLYVVDASRPMTSVDVAEMEILRLTACPRMAIFNPKSRERRFLENWKTAFRQHFNSVRTFNAQKARYLDRIELLEALKSIDQDWEPALNRAIELVRLDRKRATERVAEAMVDYLAQSLRCSCSSFIERESGADLERRKLESRYKAKLEKLERRFREETRDIFGIRRLTVELPDHSILREDLFSEKTWQALGLTQKQLAVAGALLGAGMGAGADMAAGGITFGVFASIGAALGAGSALWKGKALARARLSHLPLGGLKLTVGPNQSEHFPFIQLDRFLLYASFISNWAHARQETTVRIEPRSAKQGPSSSWSQDELKQVTRFVKAVQKDRSEEIDTASRDLVQLLVRML